MISQLIKYSISRKLIGKNFDGWLIINLKLFWLQLPVFNICPFPVRENVFAACTVDQNKQFEYVNNVVNNENNN